MIFNSVVSILLILTIYFTFCCNAILFQRLFKFTDIRIIFPLLGQILFILFITFLFNYLNLKVSTIFFLYFFLSIFSISYCLIFKINDLKYFLSSFFFLILPIIILGIFPIIMYGKNFYVFRGNHYDLFTQVSTGLLFANNNYIDIASIILKENFYNSQLYQNFSKFHYSLALPNLGTRELQPLYLSFLFQFKFLNIDLLAYLLNVYSLSSLSIAFYFFLKQFNTRFSRFQKSLFSFIFSLSFWSIYIFEINAYAQLTTYSLSIIFFALVLNLQKFLIVFDFRYFNFLCITSACIFLSYPEQSIILFTFLFIFLVYNFQLVLKNNKKMLFYFFLFLFFISPKLVTYIKLIFLMSQAQNDWWGYFGSFILGKDNLVLNNYYVEKIKLILNNYDFNFFNKIFQIIKFHLDNDYYLVITNIFPSLLGFYYLLPGKINNYFFLIFYFLFIIYLFYHVLNNFIKIFRFNNKFFFFFKVYICLFIFLSILCVIQEKIYILFKIYFFFSPILYFVIFFSFNHKAKLYPRYLLLCLMFLFPIYKFSIDNNGISRVDSFPSIIDKNTKLNMNWSLNYNELKKCSRVLLDIDDYFINLYLANNLDFYSKEYSNKKYSTIILNNFDCKISVINGEFVYN